MQSPETDSRHSTNRSPKNEEAESTHCEHCERKAVRVTLIESETYCGNHETDPSETCSSLVCGTEMPARSVTCPIRK